MQVLLPQRCRSKGYQEPKPDGKHCRFLVNFFDFRAKEWKVELGIDSGQTEDVAKKISRFFAA